MFPFLKGIKNCTVGDLPQRYRCNETPGHQHPDVSSSNVHNSQTVEGASVSSKDEWIKKLWSMYTWNITQPLEMTNTICFNMDGTGGYYAECSKSIREGQTLYGLIHLGNMKNSERE